MEWTPERRVDACVRAPLGDAFVREDTEILAREGWYELVTPSAPGAMLNEILLSTLTADDAEAAIDAALARHPGGLKWYVGPWSSPSDLGARLARRGFEAEPVCGMGASTSLAIAPSAGVVVERVTAETVPIFVDVASRGWGMPEEQRARELAFHHRALTRGVRLYLARIDGEPVGTAGMVVREDHGYLVGTQVLASARRRGVYRTLVAARVDELRDLGCAQAFTHASAETSAPLLAKLGFDMLFESRCWFR